MSFESERRSVETHFLTQWEQVFENGYTLDNITFPSLRTRFSIPAEITHLHRVAFENVRYDIPAKDHENPAFTTWVRLSINPASTAQFTLGANPIVRHNGVLTVQVFQPEHAKQNVSRVFADAVSSIFNLRSITIDSGVLQCRASEMVTVGSVNEWYQVNVNTVYVRETGGGTGSATGTLRYGLADVENEDYVEFGTETVFTSVHNDVVFPVTNSTHRHWWFEYPEKYAFGAVYNIALDSTLGDYDWRWDPVHPLDAVTGLPNEDTVYFVNSERYPVGTDYNARIHHLFEIA